MSEVWLKRLEDVRRVFGRRRLRLGAVAVAAFLSLCQFDAEAKRFVVTLDAGHGGKDYGAIGAFTNEKTITLDVVTRLGELINRNLPFVDVVYTRDTDVFIPLADRAAIANRASSDLFISVHVNSVDKKNKRRNTIEGCQVYTLGLHKTAENLAVAKRENSVMEFEDDHAEKYAGFDPNSLESDIMFELSQNLRMDQSIEFADAVHSGLSSIAHRSPKGVRQAGFWVLWATSMPAVLVELDFICNPQSEKYLATESGQNEMVISLYNAFCAYLNTYGSRVTGEQLPPALALAPPASPAHLATGKTTDAEPMPLLAAVTAPAELADPAGQIAEITDNSGRELFFVQLLASSTPLPHDSPELKGAKNVHYYKEGDLYKYAVGFVETLAEADKLWKETKTKFPGCFIIKMLNGERIGFVKP